ncbi:MAG: hypothetical protein ACHQ7M_00915 [Chloroflexota bacterium]
MAAADVAALAAGFALAEPAAEVAGLALAAAEAGAATLAGAALDGAAAPPPQALSASPAAKIAPLSFFMPTPLIP